MAVAVVVDGGLFRVLATVDLDDDRRNADRREQEIAPLRFRRVHRGRPRHVVRLQRTGRLDKAAE